MHDNMFNEDDIYQDTDSRNAIAAIFGVVIRLIMAITTGGFFAVYAPTLTEWLVGWEYAVWVSAALGMVSIDVMAWLYSYLRSNHATTTTQMSAAAAGTIGNIALSAIVTAVFFVLQTDFVPTVDAAGNLTTTGEIINIAGLVIGSLAMAGNGILWAWYQANGIKEKAQLSRNQLRAASLTGAFTVEKENQQLTIARTLENIRGQLPALTASAGKQNATHYLQTKFGEIDRNGDGRVTDREVSDWLASNPHERERFTDAVQEVQRHTYSRADNEILKPKRKYGLSRKGYMIDESDDIEVLIRNPGYDFDAYIVDRNGAVVNVDAERERATRPTSAANGRAGHSPE